jgi:excisionase family DNA binding protein
VDKVREGGGVEETEERYLSTIEVAEHFGVSSMTIYRLANDGKLPHIRVGRVFRFRLSEVERAVREENVVPPVAAEG